MNGTFPFDGNQSNLAASHFINELKTDPNLNQLHSRSINSFTSDYALYWFDYLGGYDTIFAELGSNQSVLRADQAIDLVRGAAHFRTRRGEQ